MRNRTLDFFLTSSWKLRVCVCATHKIQDGTSPELKARDSLTHCQHNECQAVPLRWLVMGQAERAQFQKFPPFTTPAWGLLWIENSSKAPGSWQCLRKQEQLFQPGEARSEILAITSHFSLPEQVFLFPAALDSPKYPSCS